MVNTDNSRGAQTISTDPLCQIEGRVSRLEQELRQLQARLTEQLALKEPWWERTAGVFEGDKMFDRVMKEIGRNRRADSVAARTELAGTEVGRRRRQPKRAPTSR